MKRRGFFVGLLGLAASPTVAKHAPAPINQEQPVCHFCGSLQLHHCAVCLNRPLPQPWDADFHDYLARVHERNMATDPDYRRFVKQYASPEES